MIDEKEWDVWKKKVQPVLISKMEEFHLLGYTQATTDDVWECFMAKLPRLDVPESISISWLVNELFMLKTNDYMNWLTLQAYKGPDLLKGDEPIDL